MRARHLENDRKKNCLINLTIEEKRFYTKLQWKPQWSKYGCDFKNCKTPLKDNPFSSETSLRQQLQANLFIPGKSKNSYSTLTTNNPYCMYCSLHESTRHFA